MPNDKKQTERWELLVKRGKDAGRNKDIAASAEYFAAAYELSKSFARIDPRRGESAYFLAFTKYLTGNSSEAIRLFNEYLKHPADKTGGEDRCAHVHSLLGAIYFGSEEMEQAENHIRKSIEMETDKGSPSKENQQFLASILMLQKEYNQAIPVLTELFEYKEKVDLQEAQKVAVMIAFAHKQLNDEKGELIWQKKNLGLHEQISPASFSNPAHPQAPSEMPEGWGLDPLGHFLEACRRNELASFANEPELYAQLSAINDRFIANRKNMVIALTKLIVQEKPDMDFAEISLEPEEWLVVYFYLRCQAAFAAAARLALTAQAPETFMVLRGCIENALYAWHISTDEKLKRIWLDRHESEEAAKAVKKQFAIGDMKRSLLNRDSELGTKVNLIYDETIDKGAHPNVKAFLSNAAQTNADGSLILAVSTLNPEHLEDLLNATISTGNLIFDIYKLIYPDLID